MKKLPSNSNFGVENGIMNYGALKNTCLLPFTIMSLIKIVVFIFVIQLMVEYHKIFDLIFQEL
jgi:hypothetical protein